MLHKMNNRYKQMFLCFCVFCVLLLVTGCGANKNEVLDLQEKNEQPEVQGADSGKNFFNDERFSEANLDDLEIGQKVSIMGTENSDGSIVANQIMIGDSETNFGELGGNVQLRERAEINPDDMKNNIDRRAPTGVEGQRGNFEQFQNMTEEEREKFREERMAQGGGAGMRPNGATGATRMNRGGGSTRLNGEIIEKDETSLTLKLDDGGSKLIFFQETTRVSEIKE